MSNESWDRFPLHGASLQHRVGAGVLHLRAPVMNHVEAGGEHRRDPRCAICGQAICGPTVRCGQCHIPYHRDCYNYLGHCAIYGCWQDPSLPMRALSSQAAPYTGACSRSLGVSRFLVRNSVIQTAGGALLMPFIVPFFVRAEMAKAIAVVSVLYLVVHYVLRLGSVASAPGRSEAAEPFIKTRLVFGFLLLAVSPGLWVGALVGQLCLAAVLWRYGTDRSRELEVTSNRSLSLIGVTRPLPSWFKARGPR